MDDQESVNQSEDLAGVAIENQGAAEAADAVAGLLPCPFCGAVPLPDVSLGNLVHNRPCYIIALPSDQREGWNRRHQQWQPIKTAPKNRTRILVCGGDCADPLSVYWDDQFTYTFDETVDPPQQRYTGAWIDDAVKSFGYEETQSYSPTHWMPLPDAPKVQATGGLPSKPD
jgi:hypothetical protein